MKNLPTKADILSWIKDNPTKTNKRDIAKAFGIKGGGRIDLKRVLKELQAEGHLEKRRKTYRDPDHLPPVSMCRVAGTDADGELYLEPVDWAGEQEAPRIRFADHDNLPALTRGDRALCRLRKLSPKEAAEQDHAYEARLIRQISSGPASILGVFRQGAEGGLLMPVDKGSERIWRILPSATSGAKDGELVEAEQTGPRSRLGMPVARVIARLGDPAAPRAVSLIAIHQNDIPNEFPPQVLAEAEEVASLPFGAREDLRDLPLVTIDPSDARDHDDACCAQADEDPENPDGHVVWVAIADVAHYVRPGSELDREAYRRGNSTYFPDRVVPMLPDRLSGDVCSLHEGVERPCLAVRMVLNAQGDKLSHRFVRGVMRSPAALNYEEVQAAYEGRANDKTAPFVETVIKPLYQAYEALVRARQKRQPLDLDMPERRIELDDAGRVVSVAFRERLDAHRLIEEFMVLANVAAAQELKAKKSPLLFRVHEEPGPEKMDALREIAQASGFVLAKGQVLKTRHLNHLLAQAAETEHQELMNISALRSMTQAYYAPENLSHFGLALRDYTHFTSPIRRYADLIVHRSLIAAHGWEGAEDIQFETEDLKEVGEHISKTERRSMTAERDTTDRYLAAYLSDRVGTELAGRVSGIARFGVFVKLDISGADGLVPIASLGDEYFIHDRDAQSLTGEKTKTVITLGQPVLVRLLEATPMTGGIALELLELDGKPMPRSRRARKGSKAALGRKLTKHRKRGSKLRKKTSRRQK